MLAISSTGCSPGEEIAPAYATILGYEQVVPFESPPENVITQNANNNLDVTFHEGRVYLAFRTAPSHFASEKTEIIVVSSEDPKTWRYETHYAIGENIYNMQGEPIRIHWLQTKNGLDREPFVPGKPIVDEGGGSETDFVFLDNGDLIAVERNEAGDELGWGSKICRAKAADVGNWSCVGDKKKYDSPLLFRNGRYIWLVGRRNLTPTGNYNLDRDDLWPADQTGVYEVEYSFQPKRCSLWRLDPDSLSVEFDIDLPSKGDTCFASMIPIEENIVDIYNYTSPLDTDNDPKWIEGQGGPTHIIRTRVELPQ